MTFTKLRTDCIFILAWFGILIKVKTCVVGIFNLEEVQKCNIRVSFKEPQIEYSLISMRIVCYNNDIIKGEGSLQVYFVLLFPLLGFKIKILQNVLFGLQPHPNHIVFFTSHGHCFSLILNSFFNFHMYLQEYRLTGCSHFRFKRRHNFNI